MSYLVLARKCRPQTFGEVVAQRHITETIKSAIEVDRLSHSYLFCGPRGTGKTSTARILAKALNCRSADGPTPEPCGECDSCVEVAASRSPDVLEIDGASNRGISEIQALRERVQYAPQGRFKVFIIDEVHMLTKQAFNALLKTLEEPPPYVVFIFATTEPHRLPATITSRCQRYDFRRIPSADIAASVRKIAASEGLTLGEEASLLVAHRADGGLRDALSILDQVLAYSPRGELSADEVAQIIGILPLEAFSRIAEAITGRDPRAATQELDKLLESGVDVGQVAEGLTEHFHGALMTAIGAPEDGLSELTRGIYDEIASSLEPEDLLRIARMSGELQGRLKTAPHPRFLFEENLIYMASFDRAADLAGMLSGQAPPPKREPKPTAKSTATEDNPATETKSGGGKLDRLIEEFAGARGEGKGEMLRRAELIEDEGRIVLHFPSSFGFQVNSILMKRENLDALRDSVRRVFGEKMGVDLHVEESGDKPKSGSSRDIPDNVNSVIEGFDAKLEN